MVADFYSKLGFQPRGCELADLPENSTAWVLDLAGYRQRNKHIRTKEYTVG